MVRVLAVFLLVWLPGCATTAGNDWTRFSDGSLNEWLDEEAVPELGKTFSQHPRFKAETIRVAALEDEQVAGRTNGLTTAIRDALHSALLQQAGLNIVRADGPPGCTMAPVDGYYLAVETRPSGNRGASVQLRVFDIVERQWVSGFGHRWRGDLSAAQREALRRPVVAESARGLRVLPFTADQSDLLAEKLAADLACQLRRAGDDEQIVQPARDRGAALIAGNLAGKHRIPVGASGALELETRVHKVDDELYQVWAILTPQTGSDELASVASSAYATRPLLKAATTARRASVPPAAPRPAPRADDRTELLSRLRVVGAGEGSDCTRTPWRPRTGDLGDRPVVAPGSCFGLEFERDPAARLFVISHQVDAGLRRLSPSRCGHEESKQRRVRVRFPENTVALNWDSRSGTETLYVIAARSRRAAGRLDRLMADLPDGCGAAKDSRSADPRWLDDIDAAVRALDDDVAWQAVRVYHQPRTGTQRLGEINGARR